eukprot:11033675-Ditylum_brightwellii.AAC.1
MSVILFLSTMFSPSYITAKTVTAGSSLSILTWQQLHGTKSTYSVLPAVKEYFQSKKVPREYSEDSMNNY